jgi:hypothetical protein
VEWIQQIVLMLASLGGRPYFEACQTTFEALNTVSIFEAKLSILKERVVSNQLTYL